MVQESSMSQVTERNPFMLMLNPEVVFAAIEKSERLSRLDRHLCRPLDRPSPTTADLVGDDDIARDISDDYADIIR